MASMSSAFESLFSSYAKFGDCRSDGKLITLSNSDKWMRESGLIVASLPVSRPASGSSSSTGQSGPSMKFTSTETGIEFKKIAKTAKAIDKKQYDALIEALVRRRIQEEEKVPDARAQIKEAMMKAGSPRQGPSHSSAGGEGITSSSSSGGSLPPVIARLTDHKRYTGSHKLRFDQETGKGRGKEGRI